MTLQVGTVLRHRYRIDGILGQGGMGAVYKAFDVNLGVEVAVKENLFTTAEFERQFEREAKILARLRHPNLPRVSDHFVVEGEGQYLVMDFILGIDLRQRLERSVPSQRKRLSRGFSKLVMPSRISTVRYPPSFIVISNQATLRSCLMVKPSS